MRKGFSNESQIVLFFNTISTAVANTKIDHATPLPCQRHVWMVDWSSQCLTGLTGYNWKPDLVLVSNLVVLCDEVTWLSPKVVGEYSKESFQLASHMGKTMDTMTYLVMVSWINRFSLGPIGGPIGDIQKRGLLTPKSEVRLGGMEGANGLFPMGGKGCDGSRGGQGSS